MESLYKHQRMAVDFAVGHQGCSALFHDPGLGKTRTCLEIFSHYRAYQPNLRLFVVCPLSLVNAAWGEDIKRFTSFSYAPFKELKDKLPDIVVINYEALISKRYLLAVQRLIQTHNFMCVLDESSRLKNNKSVTTKTLLDLVDDFKDRIISSVTPRRSGKPTFPMPTAPSMNRGNGTPPSSRSVSKAVRVPMRSFPVPRCVRSRLRAYSPESSGIRRTRS